MIIWLTGQPGSGKTTICKEISELKDNRIFHIDGDDLRDLFENKDYSEQGRRKNIELAQQIAQYLTNKGKDVLVSLVSPYKDQRDKFKEKMGDNLVEVYVHTSETRGREDFFVKEYGQPTENYLNIDTTNESIEESTKKVLDYAKNSRRRRPETKE
jgi:adenylylsulfate kinase